MGPLLLVSRQELRGRRRSWDAWFRRTYGRRPAPDMGTVGRDSAPSRRGSEGREVVAQPSDEPTFFIWKDVRELVV